jgi:uncharacterized membrane protein
MNEYLVACILLVLIFFSFGVSKFNNPGMMNSTFGYRTTASKKNQDTWDEANMYAGKCMMLCGIFLILITVMVDYIFNNVAKMFALLGVLTLISLVIVVLLTERRLKKVFFRDGKRRPNR